MVVAHVEADGKFEDALPEVLAQQQSRSWLEAAVDRYLIPGLLAAEERQRLPHRRSIRRVAAVADLESRPTMAEAVVRLLRYVLEEVVAPLLVVRDVAKWSDEADREPTPQQPFRHCEQQQLLNCVFGVWELRMTWEMVWVQL